MLFLSVVVVPDVCGNLIEAMLDPLNIDAVECNGQGSLLRHLIAWGHLHQQSCLHMYKAQRFAVFQGFGDVTQTQI